MFLSAYTFDGDPAELTAAYDRMRRGFPPDAFELHVAVVTATGIVVFDACPDRATFDAFHTSPDLQGAMASAGLPRPRVEPLGEVHATALRQEVRR